MRTGNSAAFLCVGASAGVTWVDIHSFYGASRVHAAFSIKEKGLAMNEAFDLTF
jgi:hypothetical protein